MIKHGTHDLDDTFFQTSKQFFDRISGSANYLNKSLHVGDEQLISQIRESIRVAKLTHAVHPAKIMTEVVKDLNALYPNNSKNIRKAMKILKSAWIDVPELIPGTLEYLKYLKSIGVHVTAVTNALPTWTKSKIAVINKNEELIKIENVYCIPVTRRKIDKDWDKVLKKSKYDLEHTFGVGDDIHADLMSIYSTGVTNLIRVLVDIGFVNKGKELPEHIKVYTVSSHIESIEIVKKWLKVT